MCQNEFVKYEFYGMDEVYGRYPHWATVQYRVPRVHKSTVTSRSESFVVCFVGGGGTRTSADMRRGDNDAALLDDLRALQTRLRVSGPIHGVPIPGYPANFGTLRVVILPGDYEEDNDDGMYPVPVGYTKVYQLEPLSP